MTARPRSEMVQVEDVKAIKDRGRPKMSWVVVVRIDISAYDLMEDNA